MYVHPIDMVSFFPNYEMQEQKIELANEVVRIMRS